VRISCKVFVLAILALAFPSSAYSGLVTSSGNGTLTFGGGPTNFFDPANGFVPTGFGNKTSGPTVTIANGIIEYGFADGANTDTAEFTNSTLSIGDVATTVAGAASFQMVFTNAALAGLSLTKINDTFGGTGLSGTLVGNTLTLTFAGGAGPFNSSAQFTLLPSGVVPPPPATVSPALVLSNVVGALFFGGSATNFFDPANGFVPTGFGNKASGPTVTIANGVVEYGFADGANTDTVDFTDSTLSIGDVATTTAGAAPFQMVFSDPRFVGLSLTEISDTFGGTGITGTLVGDTITLTFFGGDGPFNSSAQFTLLPAADNAVPEPSSLIMAGLSGLVGVGTWLRRGVQKRGRTQ
jgi:PEP-CTERM motif